MNYQVILEATTEADLTRLFSATRDIAMFTANKLVDNHAVLSGDTLMAQGGDTGSSSSSSSSGDGSHLGRCAPGHPCPAGAVPHDPYLIVFGAGAGIGLLVGLLIGVLVGRTSRQAR